MCSKLFPIYDEEEWTRQETRKIQLITIKKVASGCEGKEEKAPTRKKH